MFVCIQHFSKILDGKCIYFTAETICMLINWLIIRELIGSYFDNEFIVLREVKI